MANNWILKKPDGTIYRGEEVEDILARIYSNDIFKASVDDEVLILEHI